MHNVNRPIDTKRDEYRKYLERTGVLQAMSRSLTKLYEEQEKPNDAIGFVFNTFGEACESRKILEDELAAEKAKNEKLTEELEEIKAKFEAYKKAEADAAKDEDAMLADVEDIIPNAASPTISESAVVDEVVSATEPTPEPVASLSVPSESATSASPDSAATPVPIPSTEASVASAEPAADTATPPSVVTSDAAVSSDAVESTDVTMTEVTSNSV